MLLLPLNAPAFVLMPANVTSRTQGDLSRLTDFAYRWDTPEQSGHNGGLGGGISWVLDPSFCDSMLPHFPEEVVTGGFSGSFISCNDIKDAFARGFATWSANHKHVRFRDVLDTEACAASSPDVDDGPCPWELYVTTDDGVAYPQLAAYVINTRASAYGGPWWEETVRSPAGVVVSGSDPLRRSVMRFQTHICWYLDATFCYYFHALEDDHGIDVDLTMRLLLFGLFGQVAHSGPTLSTVAQPRAIQRPNAPGVGLARPGYRQCAHCFHRQPGHRQRGPRCFHRRLT